MTVLINGRVFFSESELKRKGLRPREVRALGAPDTLAPNPYGWATPMKLYDAKRIVQATK